MEELYLRSICREKKYDSTSLDNNSLSLDFFMVIFMKVYLIDFQ